MTKTEQRTPIRKPLSWEPTLTPDGKYCSPGCTQQAGRHCTKKDHDKAHKDAAALAKRMGEGWRPRIWENMGWHYEVHSPCHRISISPFIWKGKIDSYTAFLNAPSDLSGGRWTGSGKTPQAAMKAVVKEGKEELALVSSILEGL